MNEDEPGVERTPPTQGVSRLQLPSPESLAAMVEAWAVTSQQVREAVVLPEDDGSADADFAWVNACPPGEMREATYRMDGIASTWKVDRRARATLAPVELAEQIAALPKGPRDQILVLLDALRTHGVIE